MVILGTSVVPAWAAPGVAPSSDPSGGASSGSGSLVCTVNDRAAREISGLAAVDDGYVAINDSNVDSAAIKIFYLDSRCRVTGSVSYQPAARDPEDLAVAKDGTLWVADIGDTLTSPNRQTVALWSLASRDAKPVIHRLIYPDGPHDAEALLLNGDGSPVIVTKDTSGTSGIYQPTGQLQPNTAEGVPMTKVGEFKTERTGTPNPMGSIGQTLVTGGAVAPDGKRVALRTISDIYEWSVPDGDVVKAITGSKPTITPVPNEPKFGEAVAYTPDGSAFLSANDDPDGLSKIFRYQPAAAVATTGEAKPAAADSPGWWSRQSLTQKITYGVAVIGTLGLLLVVVGVLGIRRARQRPEDAPGGGSGGTYGEPRSPGPAGGQVYGSGAAADGRGPAFGRPPGDGRMPAEPGWAGGRGGRGPGGGPGPGSGRGPGGGAVANPFEDARGRGGPAAAPVTGPPRPGGKQPRPPQYGRPGPGGAPQGQQHPGAPRGDQPPGGGVYGNRPGPHQDGQVYGGQGGGY